MTQARYEQAILDALRRHGNQATTGQLLEACGWPEGRNHRQYFSAAMLELRRAKKIERAGITHGIRSWRLI